MSFDFSAYKGKRILLTGHSGFKGSWMALWLHQLGAQVHGFSLPEPEAPATYTGIGVSDFLASEKIADLRNLNSFENYFNEVDPDFVFHFAAQPLVRLSYSIPLETLESNFMGTAHVLECMRKSKNKNIQGVFVTSDKCYENTEKDIAYTEEDPMGGYDVYSMSKGACELLIHSYRRAFNLKVASVRAGNVIGGGDFAKDRLVPDCVRALRKKETIILRNPKSTRPWQHVLEPLSGYLLVGAKLLEQNDRDIYSGWNFGPEPKDVLDVESVVKYFLKAWGSGEYKIIPLENQPHEAKLLKLSIEKARKKLGWGPRWSTPVALEKTGVWYRSFEEAKHVKSSMREFSLRQISEYLGSRIQ